MTMGSADHLFSGALFVALRIASTICRVRVNRDELESKWKFAQTFRQSCIVRATNPYTGDGSEVRTQKQAFLAQGMYHSFDVLWFC
jgi:hypothetical protein